MVVTSNLAFDTVYEGARWCWLTMTNNVGCRRRAKLKGARLTVTRLAVTQESREMLDVPKIRGGLRLTLWLASGRSTKTLLLESGWTDDDLRAKCGELESFRMLQLMERIADE